MQAMPHSQRWLKQLTALHGNQTANAIISRTQIHYHRLIAADPPIIPRHPKAKKELTNLLYPGLALFRTLTEEDPDTTRVLATNELLFKAEFFSGLGFGIGLINYLPDPFPIIRPILRMMIRSQYLPGSQVVVEDNLNCFAINTTRCFKLDVLTDLKARDLTSLYCKTDDWLSEKLPKVHWRRTKTLARGDEICDFRWCRQD